jgi:uncharacterized membrane protein YdbT with pleckstrin-like domain
MGLELHPGEQVIYDGRPSWRSVMSLYLQGAAIGLVLGAIAWFAWSQWTGVLVLIGCIAAAGLIGFVRRLFIRFTITDQRLRIQRGIISRNVQQTRIDRVQNVNTRQRPIDRMLRVGAVDFETAGADSSDFTFEGVNDPAGVTAAVDRAQRLAAQRGESGGEIPGGL